MLMLVWLADGVPPATIAFTTTQVMIAMSLGVVSLVSSGVAFGRLTERQKGDHKVLHDTLETLKVGMADITKSVNELREDNQKGHVEMANWRFWRVVTDERLGDHDETLGRLTNGHDEVKTRIVVLEERRTGMDDRRKHE